MVGDNESWLEFAVTKRDDLTSTMLNYSPSFQKSDTNDTRTADYKFKETMPGFRRPISDAFLKRLN